MEVEVIKANNPFDESSKVRKVDRLRVAAYCRVSTDDEDQIKSYNSMVKYYTDFIQNNKQWVFGFNNFYFHISSFCVPTVVCIIIILQYRQ